MVHGNCETIFELILSNGELIEIRQRFKQGKPALPSKDAKIAEMFIEKYSKNIIDKWVKFFVYKKPIRSTQIKTKI